MPDEVFAKTATGLVKKKADPRAIKFELQSGEIAALHPKSINYDCGEYETCWMSYASMLKTKGTFLMNCTLIRPFDILLFGGTKIEVSHVDQILTIDGWIEFKASAKVAAIVRAIRKQFDLVLQQKISRPDLEINSSPLFSFVVSLLSTSGYILTTL